MDRKRLDKYLAETDLARSRSQAKRLIENDRVLIDGFPASKPATLVEPDANIELSGQGPKWVGRGAKKIWPFLEQKWIDPENKVCIDVGASTGGFTQALLKSGASKVHAVDVGYGQIAYKLRTDDRVIVHERTNFRHSTSDQFSSIPSLFTMDVSFISTVKLLEALNDVVCDDARGLLLIKPQFEAGPDQNEEGIVTNPEVRLQVLRDVCEGWNESGWGTDSISASPIDGDSGNIEYIALMQKSRQSMPEGKRLEQLAYNPENNRFASDK